jgi:hypothetical protein
MVRESLTWQAWSGLRTANVVRERDKGEARNNMSQIKEYVLLKKLGDFFAADGIQ